MRLVFPTSFVVFSLIATAGAQPPRTQPSAQVMGNHMEHVDGFGGFFFRSKSPNSLAKWYEVHLGITQTPSDYSHRPWQQTTGVTVFQPFPADTKYFGRPEQMFMLNFRVANLDAMVAQLRHAGIGVTVDPQTYPNGRFALTHDPEGNPIQLWQPRAH